MVSKYFEISTSTSQRSPISMNPLGSAWRASWPTVPAGSHTSRAGSPSRRLAPAAGESPAARPYLIETSSSCRPASHLAKPDASIRAKVIRPCQAHPSLLGPTHSHDAGCPRGKSCRRAGRSGRQVPPSPYGTAFSEGSGSLSVLPGSSPITFTSPSSKAHQKSGPLLRRHYPASTLLRPCPTPAMTVACRDVEAATLARYGSPPITRTTFMQAPRLPIDLVRGDHGCCLVQGFRHQMRDADRAER